MAKHRCPMCGELNPPEFEVCQHCQARLKPLIISPTPESEPEIPTPDPSAPTSPGEEAAASDWLSSLRQEESAEGFSVGEYAEDEPQQSESPYQTGEEPTDWLSRLEEPEEEETEPESEEGVLDWMLEQPPVGEGEVPDWLLDLRSVGEEMEAGEGAEEDGDAAGFEEMEYRELPKWMKEFEETVVEAVEEPSPEHASEPGWSVELAGEAELEREPEVSADWKEKEKPQEVVAAPEEAPEWSAGHSSREEVSRLTAAEEETSQLAGEEDQAVPDWFTEFGVEGEAIGAEGTPVESKERIEAGEWLSALEEGTGEVPADGETGTPSLEESPLPIQPEEGETESLYAAEIPEWLKGEFPEGVPPGMDEAEAGLAPAEIPSWLEAMRPVEDAAPAVPVIDETERQVESAGPLAGLQGVLPAEPEMAHLKKPPIYSVKLQVSQSQRNHAELLKKILEKEREARPIPRQQVISPQYLLRLAIAAVLFLAILWPLVTASQRAALPVLLPETTEVNRLINELPERARVLVSFDYQPGISGEMDTAASAVVDHLMLRGAYMTLVSTSPIGPVVAERFLATTQASHRYTHGEQYVNLGYIPGGAAGLLSFAGTPQGTLPYTMESIPAWGSPDRQPLLPLQGIASLAEYSLVMVISDNPETLRTWIEQVQPRLKVGEQQTPLVMVISAQTEPLVRPYYEASPRQVQGLVVGLRGGAAYARMTGRGGLARVYWDAFSMGLIAAALLIAIGGLVNVVLGFTAGDKKAEGKGIT